MPPILHLQDVALTFGATPLLTAAELAVQPGERICLVGRNGSGKSTLLKVAAGLVVPQAGRVFVQPGTTLRYLPQEPDFGAAATVFDYVVAGLGPADDPHRARLLLDAVSLDPARVPATLSGGEARRAALARTLAPQPDVVLLDEPTNHLDLPAIEWLEAELGASRAAIVLISHDRRLLETFSRAVVWLDQGETRRLDRGFAEYEAWRDGLLEQEAEQAHKLARKIAREEDWMRYGVTARRKRNVRRVAELAALRTELRETRRADAALTMAASAADGSGKLVAVAEGVAKSFGVRAVVRDFSARVLRRDRVGIVGPNGAGKTTLLRLLTGELPPDRGEVRVGTALAVGWMDQSRAALDPARTLADTLTGGGGDQVLVNGARRHVIGYMKDWLFRPEQARTPVGVLSGGERARVVLASVFARPSNLLVLDEPTNDLDLETLDLLQDLLGDYPGTVLLVSHDRDFLDRVVTSTIAAEGDGHWALYAGGYSDMLAQRGERAAPETAPKRTGTAAAPRQKPASTKMSFRDKHALATLPARIEALEREIASLAARLGDAGLYARDPRAHAELAARLAAQEAELAEAEEKWLALEMQREALEGA